MKLVSDWRAQLRHAWSIRFILLAGLLQGVDIVMQITVGLAGEVSWTLRILAGLSTTAAFVARFVAQPKTLGDDDADR